MKQKINYLLGVVLSFSALQATAEIYTVNEDYTGSFTKTGSSITHELVFSQLNSGDSTLFSSSLKTFVTDDNQGCSVTHPCTFEQTLRNGDLITGTFDVDDTTTNNPLVFAFFGTTTITGGTGLFANATGGGTFTGTETFSDNTFSSATTTQNSIFMVNTNTVVSSVPEPETYAMFLLGLGLLGFSVRRTK